MKTKKLLLALCAFMIMGGNAVMAQEQTIPEEFAKENIFGLGEKNVAYQQYFIGQSYLNPLTKERVGTANVTFEPGCRNNWHIHHKGGQILLVTAGRGYYQEWGKPAQELKPGDVVNIAPEVKHWHGAAPDSWFAHIAIEVPGRQQQRMAGARYRRRIQQIKINRSKQVRIKNPLIQVKPPPLL